MLAQQQQQQLCGPSGVLGCPLAPCAQHTHVRHAFKNLMGVPVTSQLTWRQSLRQPHLVAYRASHQARPSTGVVIMRA